MKLTQLQKKAIIGSAVGVLGVSAIVSPIVISLTMDRTAKWPNMISKIDQLFGVTYETYKDMKEQFRAKWKSYLELDTPYDDDVIAKKVAKLDAELEEMEASFQGASSESYAGGPTKHAYDYVTLTSTLSDFASKYRDTDDEGKETSQPNPNIRLVRKCSYSWKDIDAFYDAYANEFKNIMLSDGLQIAKIEYYLTAAKSEYLLEKANAYDIYREDTVGAITYLQSKITDIFKDTNVKTAKEAADAKVKEFYNNFEVTYRNPYNDLKLTDEEKLENCYEALVERFQRSINEEDPNYDPEVAFLKGNEVKRLFKIVDKSTGLEIPSYELNKIMPGYTLRARIANCCADGHSIKSGGKYHKYYYVNKTDSTSEYDLDVDFGFQSSTYLQNHNITNLADDLDMQNLLTGHLYDSENTKSTLSYQSEKGKRLLYAIPIKSTSFKIVSSKFLPSSTKNNALQTVSDQQRIFDSYFHEQVKKVWIDDEGHQEPRRFASIFFDWNRDENPLEQIWEKYREDGPDSQEFWMSENQLSTSGLTYALALPTDGGKYVKPNSSTEWTPYSNLLRNVAQSTDRSLDDTPIEERFATNCVIFAKVKMEDGDSNNLKTSIELYSVFRSVLQDMLNSDIVDDEGKILYDKTVDESSNPVPARLDEDKAYDLLTTGKTINEWAKDTFGIDSTVSVNLSNFMGVSSFNDSVYHIVINDNYDEVKEPVSVTEPHPYVRPFVISNDHWTRLNEKFNEVMDNYTLFLDDDFINFATQYRDKARWVLAFQSIAWIFYLAYFTIYMVELYKEDSQSVVNPEEQQDQPDNPADPNQNEQNNDPGLNQLKSEQQQENVQPVKQGDMNQEVEQESDQVEKVEDGIKEVKQEGNEGQIKNLDKVEESNKQNKEVQQNIKNGKQDVVGEIGEEKPKEGEQEDPKARDSDPLKNFSGQLDDFFKSNKMYFYKVHPLDENKDIPMGPAFKVVLLSIMMVFKTVVFALQIELNRHINSDLSTLVSNIKSMRKDKRFNDPKQKYKDLKDDFIKSDKNQTKNYFYRYKCGYISPDNDKVITDTRDRFKKEFGDNVKKIKPLYEQLDTFKKVAYKSNGEIDFENSAPGAQLLMLAKEKGCGRDDFNRLFAYWATANDKCFKDANGNKTNNCAHAKEINSAIKWFESIVSTYDKLMLVFLGDALDGNFKKAINALNAIGFLVMNLWSAIDGLVNTFLFKINDDWKKPGSWLKKTPIEPEYITSEKDLKL